MISDKEVLASVLSQALSNVIFFGIGALAVVFISWVPLLWVGVATYGIFGVINFFRGTAGLIGDIASFFTPTVHSHISQLATTAIIFLEAIIYSSIAYYFYTLIG